MLKILIPTDFSSIADNALNYAIEIGEEFESDLYLYHVYNINRKLNYDSSFSKEEQPYKKEVESKMSLTKQRFIERITQKGLSIKTKVEETRIFSLFKSKVGEHHIDLIVMGSKGASGITKVVFGSVAATALELAKVPLLVIPPEYSFHPIKNIVLATDSNEIHPDVLLPLQKLAARFRAKVTILTVKADSHKESQQPINLGLSEIETSYREVLMNNNINDSINDFIEEESCDLLCMIRRDKGFFTSLFQRSITKTQVYHNNIPLLVLPENEKEI